MSMKPGPLRHRKYPQNSLNVGSHDPFFGSDHSSGIVSAHRNADSHH